MILAIDTATQFAGLALYNEDGIFAEETWYAERNHTTELMPRLSRMLNLAKLEVVHLTALAVSLGPGSFTGLRIGLAIAKGLALPHKLPVVGVPTLEITAYPFRDIKLPVWSVAQAGRGRLLAACFDRQDDRWQAIIAPHLTTIETLAEKIEHFVLFVGPDRLSGYSLASSRLSGRDCRTSLESQRSRRSRCIGANLRLVSVSCYT
jgi:tRNA threonylcarbamoyladenosine biosynthesis protein TsaB